LLVQPILQTSLNNTIQFLPELNNFIDGLKPLSKSVDLLIKADANMDKKNWGLGDLCLFGFALLNFGYRFEKSVDDFSQFVEAVKNPKPLPTPIDERFLFALQNPTFVVLNNQTFAVQK
jgi:hypothetical protein